MKKHRRRHDAAFKARVALEATKENKSIHEIASEYEVHPAQVREWKKRFVEQMSCIFERDKGGRPEEAYEKEKASMERIIGQLTIERDFLVKKSKQLGL